MRKLLFLTLLIGAVVLTGCATTAKYETKLQGLVGMTEDDLYAVWGIPSKTMTLTDGSKLVEYNLNQSTQIGGHTYSVPQTTFQSGTATVIGKEGTDQITYSSSSTTLVEKIDPVQNINLNCKTTFTINREGKMTHWKWSGNNCISD
ncbi:MAG: hypothetical protein ISEC1_P0296 [Thiomicrorhabdus sp.]|nr:MAG: hypothetical protein ISEC1_P0296 [Thiomicrorhabdus sp.]